MMPSQISHRGLAESGYFRVQQGFKEGQFGRGGKHLTANPSPIGQAVRSQRFLPPA